MFFWRHDTKLLARARQRVRSARGAVFAEFALIAPILVMLISGMVEIAGFFDAQVMANHTAWTIGRQATVHMDELTQIKVDPKTKAETITGYNAHFTPTAQNPWPDSIFKELGEAMAAFKDLRDHGRVTAVFMMSTCGMGYFGFTPAQFAADLLKKLLVSPIKELFNQLIKMLKEKLKIKIDLPFGLTDFLNKLVQKILQYLVDKIVQPLVDVITSSIAKKIEDLLGPLDAALDGNKAWARRFKQIFGAAQRAMNATYKDEIYKISYPAYGSIDPDVARIWRIDYSHDPLDYPGAFCAANRNPPKIDNYVVKGYVGWPPRERLFPMMRVSVKWPYSMMWMFPVVSGFGGRGKGVVAEGSSLVFPQPMIDNDYLKSQGAKTYPGGAEDRSLADALEEIAKKARNYLEAMIFAIEYRLREEDITHVVHKRRGIWNDHFYKPLIYFWLDKYRKEIDENEAYSAKKPWGAISTEESDTIRDEKLGYRRTMRQITDSSKTYTKESTFTDPIKDQKQRNMSRYFYWENPGSGKRGENGRLRSRYDPFTSGCSWTFGYGKVHKPAMDKHRTLLHIYRDELRKALQGTSGDVGRGPAAIIDMNELKNLDLSDKDAVIAYFNQKWAKMREECETAYTNLDKHLDGMQNRAARFAVVCNLMEDWWKQSQDWRDKHKDVHDKYDEEGNRLSRELQADFKTAKDLEDELCCLLGSKTAAEAKGKPIDDVIDDKRGKKPDDGVDPRPFDPGNDKGPVIERDYWHWTRENGWQ